VKEVLKNHYASESVK